MQLDQKALNQYFKFVFLNSDCLDIFVTLKDTLLQLYFSKHKTHLCKVVLTTEDCLNKFKLNLETGILTWNLNIFV
jgi:hypothetical protein